MSDEQTGRAIQILTTEHFALQGARGNTVSETNGRIAIFLGMVSSTLIALAFVGKISGRAPPGSQRRSLLRVAPRPRVHRAGPSQYPVSGADLLGTVEPLEYVGQVRGRNPDALIADLHHDPRTTRVVLSFDRKPDLSAGRAVLDRITDHQR